MTLAVIGQMMAMDEVGCDWLNDGRGCQGWL